MTHPQVFGQTFTPIRRFSAWKTPPFWPHIPNMTQYGSAPPGENDIPKICRWDFLYSVVSRNGRRVKCQDICTLTEWPYPGT